MYHEVYNVYGCDIYDNNSTKDRRGYKSVPV